MEELAKLVVDKNRILDEALAGYHCELDEEESKDEGYDIPRCFQGSFCETFRFVKNGDAKCLRLWKNPDDVEKYDFADRLVDISSYLRQYKQELPFFVDFEFLPQAVRDTDGSMLCGVKMDWVDGYNLSNFINKSTCADILKIASEFMNMCQTFKKYHISHGDLSYGNIRITKDKHIRLIDYDSMFVPNFRKSYVKITDGCDGFQSSQRATTQKYVTEFDDNFSQQVIYLSLLALGRNENVRKEFGKVDRTLLFIGLDFKSVEAFDKTKACDLIRKYYKTTDEVYQRMLVLRDSLKRAFKEIPSIVDFKMPEPAKPTIKYVEYCYMCGHKFPNQTDQYCTQCGTQRLLYGNICK